MHSSSTRSRRTFFCRMDHGAVKSPVCGFALPLGLPHRRTLPVSLVLGTGTSMSGASWGVASMDVSSGDRGSAEGNNGVTSTAVTVAICVVVVPVSAESSVLAAMLVADSPAGGCRS